MTDVSFADTVQLDCSRCGRVFRAETWLIVDGSARPDLILDDKLFAVRCPACGHRAELDYPLLLYLPSCEPSLFFSPAPGLDQDTVRDQVADLLVILCESLGSPPRKAWVAGRLPTIRHGLLPSLVANPKAVRQILEIESLLQQAQAALADYARTGGLRRLGRAISLWQRIWEERLLGAVIEEFRLALLNDGAEAYLRRYWARGDTADLHTALTIWEQIVAQTPEGSPALPARLTNLGIALSDLHAQTGDSAHLARAIAVYESAVAQTPDDHPDLPTYLSNLGTGLSARYEQTGDLSDLESAIAAYQKAADGTPDDSPQKPGRLNNLANGLQYRHMRTGAPGDLEMAIEAYDAAMRRAPAGSPHLHMYLDNLSGALQLRYERTGNLHDLERAIETCAQAVEKTARGATDRPRHLSNLGSQWLSAYGRTGDVHDLDRAIAALEAASRRIVGEAPDQAAVQNNLSDAYRKRFERTGLGRDLTRSIRTARRAVALVSEDTLALPIYLNNLGAGLHARYERSGKNADLEEAISSYRQAVARVPEDAPALPNYLSNLGAALESRYRVQGDPQDLQEAIERLERAIAKAPEESPDSWGYLNNLASCLGRRYARTGQIQDLENAIAFLKEAVDRAAPDTPEMPAYLNNLGNGWCLYYAHTLSLEHLEAAVAAYGNAIQRAAPGDPERPGYLNNLGNASQERFARTGDLVDIEKAIAAYREAAGQTAGSAPAQAMYLNNLGTAFMARYENTETAHDLEQALANLQEAASRAGGAPERCQYLGNIAQALGARFARTGEVQDYHKATENYRRACLTGGQSAPSAVLAAARHWSNLALQHQDWKSAITACRYGQEAVEKLLRAQFWRRHKEFWLKDAQGIATNAAYALARGGRLRKAVLSLEQSRARLLSEALERDEALVEPLRASSAPGYERYRATVALLQSLEPLPPRAEKSVLVGKQTGSLLRTAQAGAEAAAQLLREIPGYERLLAPPVWRDIAAAAALDGPLVYIAPTLVGGVALFIWPNAELSVLWLGDLTTPAITTRVYGPGGTLGGYLGAYGAYLETPDGAAREAWYAMIEDTIQWVERVLMHPIRLALRERRVSKVVLIPSGLLGLLPLGTADGISCAHAPNARALALARKRMKQRMPDKSLFIDNPNPTETLNLPYAHDEVLAAIRICSGDEYLHLAEHEATKERVMALLPDCSVWHFSTHGAAGWHDPLQGGLLLAHAEMLKVSDLFALKAPARLAVLSACETGIPGVDIPDEVVSLATAMFQAGACGVISSLWAVNELSTALLMVRFYEAWRREGHEPPAALAAAQHWLRQATNRELARYLYERSPLAERALGRFLMASHAKACPYAHPYYWAGFYYTGV